jgi:isopenicillin N synthase-like dioxygenase
MCVCVCVCVRACVCVCERAPSALRQGFTSYARAARDRLFEVSGCVIESVERHIGINPGALRSLVDDKADVHAALEMEWKEEKQEKQEEKEGNKTMEAGVLSSTQQRLCLYHANLAVAFEAHTDTTFLTLIPCSAVAGLEVWTEANGWVRPEEHSSCRDRDTVIVLSGEFLQVLTYRTLNPKP